MKKPLAVALCDNKALWQGIFKCIQIILKEIENHIAKKLLSDG